MSTWHVYLVPAREEITQENTELLGYFPVDRSDSWGHGVPAEILDRQDDEYVVLQFEVDVEENTVEWVPGIGPNPIWRATLSEVSADLVGSWHAWAREIY